MVKESGLCKHLCAGDLILADKGFLISDIISQRSRRERWLFFFCSVVTNNFNGFFHFFLCFRIYLFGPYCTFTVCYTFNMEEKKIFAAIEKIFNKKLELIESMLEKKLGPIIERLDNKQLQITKIVEIEKSINFLSDKFDETVGRIAKLEKENASLRNDNQCLRGEVHRSRNLLAQMKDDFNDLQQYSRWDCLELRGLPDLEGEDTNRWVKKVGQLINIEVNNADISTSHRLPPRKATFVDSCLQEPAIIVKFLRRDLQEKFYSARKQLPAKTTRDLGLLRHTTRKIFISESFTRQNRKLLNRCLIAK